MKIQFLVALLTIGSIPTSALAAPMQNLSVPGVSAQGKLILPQDTMLRVSPRGSLQLQLQALEGDFHRLVFRVQQVGAQEARTVLPRLSADEVFATDTGHVVAIRAHESNRFPTSIRVFDLAGKQVYEQSVSHLSGPSLSPDGTHLAYRSNSKVYVLGLQQLQVHAFPAYELFSLGYGGALIGVGLRGEARVEIWKGARFTRALDSPFPPIDLALLEDGRPIVLGKRSLVELDLRRTSQRVIYQAPVGFELRDLMQIGKRLYIGRRTLLPGATQGSVLQIGPGGFTLQAPASAVQVPGAQNIAPLPLGMLPWPLWPNSQHPIGNSYGEYQNYGGAAYLHPGIDILGADNQPVYAVHSGVVKAILTTSGTWHWRIAIANQAGSGTSIGYLYAHIDQPSLAVNVGDTVVAGQYLGNLVPWPVTGFTHCHFARIIDSGPTWSGAWINTDDPHIDFVNRTDAIPPVFEHAIGTDAFAFCNNNTASYQNPGSLTGKVDIIARISDDIGSPWRCAVQRLHYSIYPQGMPGSPVVNDRLSVNFDLLLDTYAGGPVDPFLVDLFYKRDGTCPTQGDYNSREFYHIITNSNGDQVYDSSDVMEAWNTALLADGNYVIDVRATDATGNVTVQSMTVTTNNGNP
jgi:murein DD-endopeptidase MepM/ murein hydrolase activator NlpD